MRIGGFETVNVNGEKLSINRISENQFTIKSLAGSQGTQMSAFNVAHSSPLIYATITNNEVVLTRLQNEDANYVESLKNCIRTLLDK